MGKKRQNFKRVLNVLLQRERNYKKRLRELKKKRNRVHTDISQYTKFLEDIKGKIREARKKVQQQNRRDFDRKIFIPKKTKEISEKLLNLREKKYREQRIKKRVEKIGLKIDDYYCPVCNHKSLISIQAKDKKKIEKIKKVLYKKFWIFINERTHFCLRCKWVGIILKEW